MIGVRNIVIMNLMIVCVVLWCLAVHSQPFTMSVSVHRQNYDLVLHLYQRPEDAVADFMLKYKAEFDRTDKESVQKSVYTKLCTDVAEAAHLVQGLIQCDGRPNNILRFTTEFDNLGMSSPTVYVRAGYSIDYYIGAICELVECNDAVRFFVRKGLHPYMFEPSPNVEFSSKPEVAVFVNIRSGWNELNHIILLRNETSEQFYAPLVESYCWINAYMYRCRAVLEVIRHQIATQGAWEQACRGGLAPAIIAPSGDCDGFARQKLLSWRTEFGEDYVRRKRILYAHGLSTVITNREYEWNVEIVSLEGLQRLLAERDCVSDEATEALQRTVAAPGAERAFLLGLGLQLSTTVPCTHSLWAPGRWQLRPVMGSPNSNSAVVRCPSEVIVEEINPGLDSGEWLWPIFCPDYFPSHQMLQYKTKLTSLTSITVEDMSDKRIDADRHTECLVYTFHSSGHDRKFAFGQRCKIVAIDTRGIDGTVPAYVPDGLPATALRPRPRPNNHISAEDREADLVKLSYNRSITSFVTSMRREKRSVDLLSLRCGGCEWSVLDFLARFAPDTLDGVCGLAVDLHLSVSNVNASYDMFLLTTFYEEFVQRRGFRLWYRHLTKQIGEEGGVGSRDKADVVHPLLVDVGFPADVGVYQLIMHRPDCRSPQDHRVDQKPDETSGSGKSKAARRPAVTNSWFPAGLSNYRDTHQYISGANLTVAVMQQLNTVHSELLGPMVDLLHAAGFSNIIIYFDADGADNFLSAGYFAGWEQWNIRPTRDCLRDSNEWDFLLLTTGDEVIYGGLQAFILANAHRVLALQHNKFWTEPGVLHKNMYLTPAEREHLFLFPFISLAPAATSTELAPKLQQFAADAQETFAFLKTQRAVLLLGTVGDSKDLRLVNRVKDVPDVLRFLRHNPSNFVLNIAREVLDFGQVLEEFPLQSSVLEGVSSEELRLLLETMPVDYIWVPVAPHSHYTRAFASSIAIAFAFKKILVMPRHLAELYGMSAAVIVYEHSITEVDFNAWESDVSGKRARLLLRMDDWERGQRVQNVLNLYKCITSKCL